MDALTLYVASASEAGVAALITAHFELMRASSPEDSCHVLPVDALVGEHMIAAEMNGAVIGMGALKQIEPLHGELKSMHTAASARGQGVARQILRALVLEAQSWGLTRVSLETGSAPLFTPARQLYASEGFEPCGPFGAYAEDPFSVFMTRAL